MWLIRADAFTQDTAWRIGLDPFSNRLDLELNSAVSVARCAVAHANGNVDRADWTVQFFVQIHDGSVAAFALNINPTNPVSIRKGLEDISHVLNSVWRFGSLADVGKNKSAVGDGPTGGQHKASR